MKQIEIVLYPEKMSDFEELDARIREWKETTCDKWLIVRHDPYASAEYSNELHYHYYLHFRASWTLENVAKSLKIETHQIEKIHSKWITAILYARHINQTPKPLISSEFVETNIEDYEETCKKALSVGRASHDHKLKALPQAVVDYANGKISYSRLRSMITFEQFNDFKRDIDNAKAYRVKKGVQRNMKVVYITGAAGSGKTTLAKFLGDNQGYEIFISGSGSDPLDGYDNEECIILDDLRADYFTKSELFKLLDNNTNSTVKSRYFNKAITNCRLLIITSIKEPHTLYDWKNNQSEPFNQLARRLNYVYLFVNKGKIYECYYDKEHPLGSLPTPKLTKELDMQLVFNYYGIVERLGDDMRDLMRSVSNVARSKLETQK